MELQAKCDKDHKILLKFIKGQENLDKILWTQRASFNNEGIWYNHFSKKNTYKNFFIKSTPYKKYVRTCNWCSKIDHIACSCPLRKSSSKIIQIWIPNRTRPLNMVDTNGPKFFKSALRNV